MEVLTRKPSEPNLTAAGQGVQDFADILVNQLSMGARASADSTANAFSNLQNATFELQAAIGQELLPIVNSATRGFTDFLSSTAELIARVGNSQEIIDAVSMGLQGLDAQFADTQPIATRNTAIESYISVLETARDELQDFTDFQRDIDSGTGQQGAFGAFTGTAIDLSDEIAQIGLFGDEIEQFQGILEGSALAIDFFAGRVSDLSDNISRNQGNIAQWTERQRELAKAGESSSDEYSNLNKQIIEANGVITALRSELSRYNAIVAIGEENLNRTSLATNLFTLNQEAATQAVKDGQTALEDAATAYGEHVAAASRARENLENLSEAQEVLNVLWMVASGQLEDYSASIEIVIPSIIDLTEAEAALNASIDTNLETLNLATEAYESYGLALTSASRV